MYLLLHLFRHRVSILVQVGQDGLAKDSSQFVDHENADEIHTQHLNVQLVDANVEQIQLEVGEFEHKTLNEH